MSHPSEFRPMIAPNGDTVLDTDTNWQNGLLRRLVLADHKTVKLDRVAFLQLLALRDTAEQVVADLVSMFTETGE